MVESWFGSIWKTSKKKVGSETPKPQKMVVGVLSLEVANVMSKVVHLWRTLDDEHVGRVREEVMASDGIKKLVSDDEDSLDELVCLEVIENLMFIVKSVARFGKKCVDPVLQRFENVFDELVKNNADLFGWEYKWKKMDKKSRKLDKYIRITAKLYHEMEILSEYELTMKKLRGIGDISSGNPNDFTKKVVWQRQEVKSLRDGSLWNKTFDDVVLVLARSLFTIVRKINYAFGIFQGPEMNINHLPRSRSISALRQMSVHPTDGNMNRFASGPLGRQTTQSGPLGRSTTKSGPLGRSAAKSRPFGISAPKSGFFGRSATKSGPISGNQLNYKEWETYNHSSNLHGKSGRLKKKNFTPAGPFKGCVMGGNTSPVLHSYAPVNGDYVDSDSVDETKDVVYVVETPPPKNIFHASILRYSSKSGLLDARPLTLGAAGLALHYADVIVVIEKYVESPQLIGADARDDLYHMLTTSIKAGLRARLKSFEKSSATSYRDSELATEWREALARIVEWLAPLAHNMKRWQSERSFQQQHLVSRTSVLLVQTLFFANQAKTEAAITELLVGLNYLWRFCSELNEKALLECTSSIEFDDYTDSNT
ncbi:hypothetical protein ACHQM5_020296 [Ranunculus cassubicifolius]